MSAVYSYKWVRYPFYNTTFAGAITEDISNPFAVYASDAEYGVRLTIDDFPEEQGVDHCWRQQIFSSGNSLILDVELKYRVDNGVRSLYGQYYDEDGDGLGWNNWTFLLGSGGLILIEFDLMGSLNVAEDEDFYDSIGTATARFERRKDGVIQEGGLTLPAGVLGEGFDIRALAIKEFEIIDPVVCLNDHERHTVNLKGEVWSLPVSTDLFENGWVPDGDLTFYALIGNFATPASDYLLAVTSSVGGKIAEFDLANFDGQNLSWNGKADSGDIVHGLSRATVRVKGPNPDSPPDSESEAATSGIIYTYECPTDTCTLCFGVYGLSYTSSNSHKPPASMGYGWNSIGSMRIDVSGNEMFFNNGSGSALRWTRNGGNFEPFNPGNYATLEEQTYYWKVSFKDHSELLFEKADGKLSHSRDRNDNYVFYGYDSNGHLNWITDQNGRYVSYLNRDDGQHWAMNSSDNPGRTTHFAYYDDDDPISPNRLWMITDAEDNNTQFLYDTSGRILVAAGPQEFFAAYEYDEYGRVVREQDDVEVLRYFWYTDDTDEGGTQLEIWESVSSDFRQRYEWRDQLGRVTAISELVFWPPDNGYIGRIYRETSYGYNDPYEEPYNPNPYLLTSVTDDNLNTIEMTYTEAGNLKTVRDKAGNITTYEYAEEIDSPLLPKHRNLLRNIYRPPVTVDGGTTIYNPTSFRYDVNGNLEKIIDAKGNETFMTYDVDGLVLTITNRNGNTSEFVYDGQAKSGDSRNLLEIRTPKGESPSYGYRRIRFEYDDEDNIISIKDDLDNEVITTYDLIDRPATITDARGKVTSFTYDRVLLSEVLLPANNGSNSLARKVSMVYDNMDRLLGVLRDIDNIGTQESRVEYSYTKFSQLASLTRDKNGVPKPFAFSYDKVGRLLTAADTATPTGVTSMAYEPFCVGHASTSARGIRRKTSLDNRCLPTQLEVGDPDPTDPLEIVAPREVRQWEHDELGRTIKTSQSRSSVYGRSILGFDSYGNQPEERFYRYDELDRLVEMRFRRNGDPLGANDKILTWAYDPEGNVVQTTGLDGQVTRYAYYRDNLLKEVRIHRSGSSDRVFSYFYDLAGRPLRIEYPSSTGLVAKFDDGTNTPGSGWDATGQLVHLRYEKDGNLIRRLQLTYDDSGNRASLLDVTDGSVLTAKAIKWEFFYDWLDRLVTVNRSEAADVGSLPGTTAPFSSYTYDSSDNRLTYRDEVADKTYRYVVDDADNLVEIYLTDGSNPEVLIESIQSDPDGNMITRTSEITNEVITYAWDDWDRLFQVSSAISGVATSTVREHNRYNMDGIRKRKLGKNSSSSHEYSAGISTVSSQPVSSGSSAPTISYVQGHQILGAEVNGNWHYFLTDSQGTVRDIVDDTGDVIQSYEFNEHGIPMPGSGAGTGTFSPKTYQGGLSVNDDRNDSGLYLMGHRHYAPDLGRFISRDPIGFRGGLNLFGTAFGNNPVTFVDPMGLFVKVIYDLSSATMTVEEFEKGDGGAMRSVSKCTYKNVFSGTKKARNDWTQEHVIDVGPIPRGNYYLGYPQRATNRNLTGQTMWIPVLDKATLLNEHQVTTPDGKTVTRTEFMIHPGLLSAGCMTFQSNIPMGEPGYPGNPDYEQLLKMVTNTSSKDITVQNWWGDQTFQISGTLEVRE